MNNEKQETLVSIVMPVYNVEKYLRQSLDSVVGQTYKNIEIICVDDGSTDSSGSILNEYAERDSRVQVISQRNQGVSAARNNGMDRARGKYIIFWDPDDHFDFDAIRLLTEKAESVDADVCACDGQHFYSDTGKFTYHRYIVPPYPESDPFSWHDCPDRIFFITSSSPWNKLVRLSLLRENDIRFPDVKRLEDNEFMLLLMCYASRITILKRKLIFYRMDRQDSLVHSADTGSENVIIIFRRCYDELNRRGLLEDEVLRKCFFDKTASMYDYRIRYSSAFDDYAAVFEMAFDQLSPLSDYDASVGQIKRIDEMKSHSAGDYLLMLYQRAQQTNDINKQNLLDARKQIRELKKENEKLAGQNIKLSQKAEKQEQRIERLIEKRDRLKERVEKLVKRRDKLIERRDRLIDRRDRLLEKQEELIHSNENLSAANKKLDTRNKALSTKLEQIQASNSFRIGRAVTSIPRSIRKKLKH